MSDVASEKKSLRARMRARRASLGAFEQEVAELGLFEVFMRDVRFSSARVVAGYLAERGELSVTSILYHQIAVGATVVLPRIDPATNVMEYRKVPALNAVLQGRYGIAEPDPARCELWDSLSDIDLVLVPGVAFDRAGWRLGQGGGYYDRFLRAADPTQYIVGIAYDWQVIESVPHEAHDVRIPFIATPSGLIKTEAG